jgi:beta-aspartyl-dipeptidase (metallo-type)
LIRSAPKYDSFGNLIKYDVGKPETLLNAVKSLVHSHSWRISEALQFVTVNPAKILNLKRKGSITSGYDADLLILDSSFENIEIVFAKGKLMKTESWIKKDMFE